MCEVERREILNSLSLASTSPDEFANNIMQKTGYLTKLVGEAVHIIKCTPTSVKIHHTRECYEEFPVIAGNTTWFLTPKTHILIKTGTQVDCDIIIPPYYKIDGCWIKLLPKPRRAETNITTFKSRISRKWEPENLNWRATSGIYSQQDLKKFEESLRGFFPLEKKAIVNTITRSTQRSNSVKDDFIKNLLTETTLTNIAENTWKKNSRKIWGIWNDNFWNYNDTSNLPID